VIGGRGGEYEWKGGRKGGVGWEGEKRKGRGVRDGIWDEVRGARKGEGGASRGGSWGLEVQNEVKRVGGGGNG